MGKRNFGILNPAIVFIIAFLIVPVVWVFILYPPVFSMDLSLKKILVFSFEQSFLSTILSFVLGFLSGYLVSKTNMAFKSFFLSLPTISFILPGLSLVMAMVVLFGKNGIFHINLLYSIRAIIFAHVLYNFPIFMKFTADGFQTIQSSIEEDFDLLSSNKLQKITYLYIPMLSPYIISAAAMVFIYCFTSFSIVLLLGGGKYATLEVHIYMYLKRFMDFNKASGMILLQFFVLAAFTFLLFRFKSETEKISGEYKIKKYKFPLWGYFLMVFLALFIFIPLFTVLVVGFIDFDSGKFTLKYMKELFSSSYNPAIGTSISRSILNSVIYAGLTAIITTVISLLSVKNGKKISSILISTMAITPISIAFGYLLLQNNFFYINKYILLPLIYSVLSLPIAFNSILRGYESISPSNLESAALDGANAFQTLIFVELPLMARSIATAMIFSFSIAISEVGATLLLYDEGKYSNISVALVRFISSRKLGEARALGSLLMMITFGIFFAVSFLQKKFGEISD